MASVLLKRWTLCATHLGYSHREECLSAFLLLPHLLQILPLLLSLDVLVEPNSSPTDVESSGPYNDIKLVLYTVLGEESLGRDSGDGSCGEVDVGEVQGLEPLCVVRDSFAVQS